ncbi:MAG: cystathionine beta-lyase [Bacteroidetes bacterium]|nr:MAG: cystathionine beta-lyase [Bacteroidota bacterium]
MWNFDEIIPREKTNSVKYDLRSKLYGSEDIIPMWVADMDFKTPPCIVDAIKKRAEHEIYGYTFRNDSFFDSVIHWMNLKHSWQLNKKWITFSPGVVPALALSVLAYTKPGDKIIAQPPVYFPFFSSVKNNGRQLVYNQLKHDKGSYHFDFENLKKNIDSRTKMILISNPHNPVGRVWSKEELTELAEICLENDILMISDEIHSDLVFKPNNHIPLASISEEIADKTISTFAPSKTFNIAGLSSSVIIISNQKLKICFDNFINDMHLGNGNIFGNVALESAYFNGTEWLDSLMDYLEGNIALVKNFIDKPGIKIKMEIPESTYLLWLDFNDYNLQKDELNKLLVKKAKVGLSPGELFGPGGEGFQRMNIACPRSILKEALVKLEKTFS